MKAETTGKRKPHPRETTNFLSYLTIWWMLPVFFKGCKRDLKADDLWETFGEHRSDQLGDRLEAQWEKEKERALKNERTPSFLMTIVRAFGPTLIYYSFIAGFIELIVKMCQPLALGSLVLYYSTDILQRNINDAYLYASIIILSAFIVLFSFHPYILAAYHLTLKMHVSCCSLMYRKALRLSKSAMHETTVGQIVNLMSNDVTRLSNICVFFQEIWIGPAATVIVTAIMYQEIGYAAFFGTCYIVCYIPFQSWLGSRSSVARLKTALRTDERLRLMNEIINGIQVIKMYTWEKPFAALIAWVRKKEVSYIRVSSYIQGVNIAFCLFTTRTAIFLCILSHVLLEKNITASQVYVVTACLNTLKHTMTDFFPLTIFQLAEAYVSIKRIQTFLLYDETKMYVEDKLETMKTNLYSGQVVDDDELKMFGKSEPVRTGEIVVQNVTARWNNLSSDNTLTDISLGVKGGGLLVVIGPVGSGKTSLLHAILRELPLTSGAIRVDGAISYASQEPWLFAGSVRQNILFGQPMDKQRYQKVVHCCALKTDFSLLPYGDRTIVGERGVSLSGGQRARINLARAVYKEADIYLLDDPLSAVDTHVGKQLFDTCINGFLKPKTVILVTHQLQYLKDLEQIVILHNGTKQAEGSYHQLKETGLDFMKLLDEQPHEEEIANQYEGKTVGTSVLRRKCSTQSSFASEGSLNKPEEVEEEMQTGRISAVVYSTYLKSTGSWYKWVLIIFMFVFAQVMATSSDYFVSHWVNLEDYRARHNMTTNTTTSETSFWDFSRDACIYIYSTLIIITIISTLSESFVFFNACLKASITLHNAMFESIARATMRFFGTNPTGRILNRFAKDVGNVDCFLPEALIDVLQIGLSLVGVIVMVTIVNQWLIIPTLASLIMLYGLRVIYLRTSRNIKRLEGVTNSPVFSHVAASLQGLTTIRAFKTEAVLRQEFDRHQDLHSTAWYLFLAASRTFAMWLDFVCLLYLVAVTISFFIMDSEIYGGNVGLAITQVMGMLGDLQWGIRQTSELENHMTSVERIIDYCKIEHERELESKSDKKPPSEWPAEGRIEFQKLYLTYEANDPPVLRNLNFRIEPKEKIGIVGRTGAGKSSLIAALFQLTETEGAILVDGRNIKDLGLHDLRSKISIIPQEPVLFSGTMRKNLDPFDEYSDEVLWRALEEVELKQAVKDLAGGLNSKMSEGGTNFSVGQRQLVCLARAIVRNNRILVLDEATANVDPQTDTLIQKTIRTKFAECTVLTIAHRLHTVMDSDRVLVMDAGAMVEFDHPHLLLQDDTGFLYSMVERTGSAMADTLKNIAKETYQKTKST